MTKYMPLDRAKALAGWSFIQNHTVVAPRMLVKGLLPYRGICFIGGQSGAGKSFIAAHLSTALASASTFFDRAVRERVGVAIIAAEGTDQIGNRLTADAQARGLNLADLPIAWRGGAALKSAADVDAIGKQLLALRDEIREQHGVRLGASILDTVAANFDMEDENSNSEVAKAIAKMRVVGEKFEGLVIPIHHYGKTASSGLRGGSAWRAGADVVLSVICNRNELTGEISGRELALSKARDGIEGPIAPFELPFRKLGLDEYGDEFGTCIVVPNEGGVRITMKMSPRLRLALEALANCRSKLPPPDFGLPAGLQVVSIDEWRDEIYARGILDRNAKNPREEFKRIKLGLADRKQIGIRNDLVWCVINETHRHAVTSTHPIGCV
jgi:AAA domain